MKRKYWVLLGAFVLGMSLVMVFGENGLLHAFRLKRELQKLVEMNRSIRVENTELLEEIDHLRDNTGYLELQAHKQGLVKEGEIVFQYGRSQ